MTRSTVIKVVVLVAVVVAIVIGVSMLRKKNGAAPAAPAAS